MTSDATAPTPSAKDCAWKSRITRPECGMIGGMKRHHVTLKMVIGVVTLTLASCRSSGDFRLHYEPDPVPREARSGHAWFRARIDSLARRRVRVGEDGPWLPPGQSMWIDVDLPPDRHLLELPLFDSDGLPVARLETIVRSRPASMEAERALPLPMIAGSEPRIIAGFHASNHRRAGRRRALDLVPKAGIEAYDANIQSSVAGKILGVTDDAPDVPGGQANEVLLLCDDGKILLFSHLRHGSIPWRPGDRLEAGDVIGRIGLSGATTGPHLHLELVRENATARGARQ